MSTRPDDEAPGWGKAVLWLLCALLLVLYAPRPWALQSLLLP